MSEPGRTPNDQAARVAIVAERARNVAVVAGAGTGKTQTIITRAVELLAPHTPGAQPISIKRLAALTFTRRAAGELRFRIREQLLRELGQATGHAGERVERLRDALSNLDAAFIGTIHGFADRLLRLRPVEAKLSPAYALVEDNAELVRETFVRLRRAAEAGTLRAALGRHGADLAPALVAEAAETLRAAARAGLQMERAEGTWGQLPSVEAVLASMIETRDIELALPPVPDPGVATARAAVVRVTDMVSKMRRGELGHQRLRRLTHALQRVHEIADDDAAEAFRSVQDALRGRPLYKGRDFDNDAFGWAIKKEVLPDEIKPGSLAEQLRAPHRWLAVRLVRLFPVLAGMYGRVKDEHEVVDYLDLLVKLRNVLRDDRAARGFYQELFDHLFVDEFQDTDPLQCEIVFYLCEDGANADRWDQARLRPGKLTIVGDPKQSIYRFRRADIVMYDRAAQRLRASGAFEQRLDTNFRSRPELIAFFNAQLGKLLGQDATGPVDSATGRASYENLTANPALAPAGVCVHMLPYAGEGGEALLAANGRAIEAAAVARYVRWLLGSGQRVRDPDSGEERALRPGDIAILACVTTNLRLLLEQFDGLGIEYSARGGVLFLTHPVVRQYLLGLRALADPDDGVAQAALLRPPFFALDCADVVAGTATRRAAHGDELAESRGRYEASLSVIRVLREQRFHRAPGATARDLIERSALGRTVATGRNGPQTLAALYEVAWEIDRRAALDRLDFDAATELMRTWAEAPVFLDVPEPLDAGAVRVMTIHQAKGLEFPAVILWDGFQMLRDTGGGLWRVERDGTAWALSLGAITLDYPPGSGLIQRERKFAESERRRMYYVAATRARDLLVLPLPLTKSESIAYATKALADGADGAPVRRVEAFRPDAPPEWARGAEATAPAAIQADDALQAELDARAAAFRRQIEAVAAPIAVPTAVTAEAKRADEPDEAGEESERERKAEASRYGAQFGVVVHRALELCLCGEQAAAADAVQVAAAEAKLAEQRAEAAEDVERALAALQRAGIGAEHGWQLCCEYPIYDVQPGQLLSGFIDLLAVSETEAVVIDFKSDQPHDGDVATAYPVYAEQLRLYGEALTHSGRLGGRRLRLGLLLTATGELRWLG